MTASYEEFLASKALSDVATGIDADVEVHPKLFPFQRDIVRWALRRGRAALFEDCGLGKTFQQVEWAKHVAAHTKRPVLILAPLAVAQQTVEEAAKIDVTVKYVREQPSAVDGIYVTNYDILGHFDASAFGGVVLDESSILKSFSGVTRNSIIEAFADTPFKLACTATPAPNDHMELGNHSEFLGAMTRAEMLAMFFVHDGGETQKWRLKGHGASAFWKWCCSWAINLRKPSDLGYEDAGFALPPLDVHHHVVSSDHKAAQERGLLFNVEARTLTERRGARKSTVGSRVDTCAALANASDEQWLIWCNLNAEGDALAKAIPGSVQVAGSDDPDDKANRMLGFAAGEHRVLISKSSICGFGMNFQRCSNVAFCGLSDSFEAYYQSVRRSWRFGQEKTVRCHIVTSDVEGAVVANIKRKEAEAEAMAKEMVENMSLTSTVALKGMARDTTAYHPTIPMRLPSWLVAP